MRKSLDTWIQEAVTDIDKSEPCSALQLCHKRGYSDTEIHSVTIAPGMGRTPKDLANLFLGKAQTHCQDFRGSQEYILKAYYGSNEPKAHQPIRINPPPKEGEDGMQAEEPTAEGGLVQIMRQQATMFGEVLKHQRVLNDQQGAFTTYIGQQLLKAQEENAQLHELVYRAIQDKINLDHDKRMKEMEFQRSTEERKLFAKAIPGLLNKVTGQEVFPQSTVDTQIIETMAEKITPEQLVMIEQMGMFPPEFMAVLKTRFADHVRKQAEDYQKTRELMGFKDAPQLTESAHVNGKS
jgi:hypothetical protein